MNTVNLSTISVELFNTLQLTACEIGEKKPIFCQCRNYSSCYHIDEETNNPEIYPCAKCDRLVPWCFMGFESDLCDECWGKQKRN